MIYCYFGHHKCASTWISSVLQDLCDTAGLVTFRKQSNVLTDVPAALEAHGADFYICQTSVYEKIEKIPDFKGFHVIRDPRDVIVSAYFSHMYSHSTEGWEGLYRHRQRLKKLDKDEGLMLEIEFSAQFLDHMQSWNYNDSRILEMKMETLTGDPVDGLREILDFLGLYDPSSGGMMKYQLTKPVNRVIRKLSPGQRIGVRFNDQIIERIAAAHSFKKLAKGREVSEENVKSHYRKGTPGDWKNHLNQSHLQRLEDRLPGLVKQLGYQ